ncbi:MAG: DNA cytosine methyltransferase [Janthinobacterium lividum]
MAERCVLDLFSGIGGFSLGLHWVGFRTIGFCESDQFCQRLLARHWPGVPIYPDIRTLDAARIRSDGIAPFLVCGGFPCQDVSLGGPGTGLDGARSGLVGRDGPHRRHMPTALGHR